MKTLVKNNFAFYVPYILFVIVGGIIILKTEQFALHTYFNSLIGNNAVDFFFKYETHLGDGLLLIAVGVILFFFNFKSGLFLLLSYAASGGFTQFLKEVFFNFEMRPYFHHVHYNFPLKIIEGVDMNIQNSFPSGHSTSAFCLFFCLSFLFHKNWQKTGMFVLAIITGFSRVYLSQHFFEDVFVGSIIGVGFSSILAYVFYVSRFSQKVIRLEQPIYKVFRKQYGQ